MSSEKQPPTPTISTDLREDWPQYAACLGQDLYTADGLGSYHVTMLTNYCLTHCPVVTECLVSAAAEITPVEVSQKGIQYYIRGGLSKKPLNQACREINHHGREKSRQEVAEQIIAAERTRRKIPDPRA